MKPGNFFFLKDSYFEKFSDQQGILIRKARSVIAKYNHGVKLIFPDVHKMCKELNANPIEQFCQNWVNAQADNNLNMESDNTITEEEEQGW